MNKNQLAHAFNVTPETISGWQRRGLPVAKRGRNGEAYEFSLSDVVRWRVDTLKRHSGLNNEDEIKGWIIALFEAFGGGLALWAAYDYLDLPPDEAVLVAEATLKFMLDATGLHKEDVPDGTLAAELLTPEGRVCVTERVRDYQTVREPVGNSIAGQ